MRTNPRGAPRAGRLILPALAVLVLLLGLQLPLPALAGSGTSAAEDDTASLTLSNISPAVASPNAPLVVLGEITNTGDDAIADPAVRLSLNGSRLSSRDQVTNWMNGSGRTATTDIGRTVLDGPLQPGKSAAFQLLVRPDRLPAIEARTNLAAALSVTDGTDSDAEARATIPTAIPWAGTNDEKVTRPLDVSWVVPLTLPADPALFSSTGADRLAAWRRAIGPGSAVDQLLRQLRGLPVTWLVDPSMLEPPISPDEKLPAADAAPEGKPDETPDPTTPSPTTPSPTSTETSPTSSDDGTQRPQESGSSTPSEPSPSTSPTQKAEPPPDDTSVSSLVGDLRQRLVNREGEQPVWWLPYGDPDLLALQQADGKSAVRRRLARLPSTANKSMSNVTVHWPAAPPSARELKVVTGSWSAERPGDAPPTLLDGRQVSDSEAGRVAHRLGDGTPVLAYDEGLSALTEKDGEGGDGQRVQHFLADTLSTYLRNPDQAHGVLVLAPRLDQADAGSVARLIHATEGVPWMRAEPASTPLSQTDNAKKTARVVRTESTPKAPASPITRATLGHAASDRRLLGDLGSILVDSDDVISGWSAAYDELASARWRGADKDHATTLRQLSTALHKVPNQVTVLPGSINFFTDGGEVGVTVVNELRRPLRNVRLVLEPRLAILEVRDQPEPMTLRADTRATLRVPFRALSSGQVEVDARLSTPTGQPLGASGDAPTQLEFTVRPTGSWLYWVLGAVAGPILVIGVYRSLRKPRREPEPASAPDDPPPESDDD